MPNRIIKESICTNEQIDSLSPFEEICFYRLIVNCDDYGRCDARTAVLRARLFPLRDLSNKEIENALDALQKAGLIARYTVDDRPYLCLTGWNRNQKVRTKRAKHPAPPGWQDHDSVEHSAEDEKHSAEPDQQIADREIQIADHEKHFADREIQIVNHEKQIAADCVLNPIQSESQSESRSETVSESRSETESETRSVSPEKEDDEIYNNNWLYSPRARAATAQILVNRFHREHLACTELRDLFVVVERALSLGIPPEDITRAARTLRASAFAARYMSLPDRQCR